MATWAIEVRVPGAGGAWTAISPNVGLTYGKDLNQLQTLDVVLPLLSGAEEALVIEGNDIRILADASERWYGQIRDVKNDPYTKKWPVKALGKGVLAQDKTWASRREWVNIPPEVIVDEVLGNVMDEELRAGLVCHLDGETMNAAGDGLEDLSGNGNDALFRPTSGDTSSRIGKWGLAREFDGNDDWMNLGDVVDFEPASRFSVVIHVNLVQTGDAQDLVDKHQSGTFLGYLVRVLTNGDIVVLLGNGTATTTLTSTTLNYPYDGAWHDIVVRWDDSDDDVFVELDGESENLGTFAGPISHGTKSLRIGGPAFVNHIEGGVDLFLFYNDRRLSLAQSRAAAGRGIYAGGLLADSFAPISFRAENDSRLRIVDGICKAIGAEWFTDRDGDDRDRFRLVTLRGGAPSTDSFRLGQTVVPPITRDQDREAVRNDIIALGYGDGQNQLRSRIWHATTIRDFLSQDYTASDTGPINVEDGSTFPTSGIVFVGMERVLYVGKSATQLGTTSVDRGAGAGNPPTTGYEADGYESLDAYLHKKRVAVWLHADTTTTPDTYYDPSIPQTGSSIQVNTHRQDSIADKAIIDQNTLDRLAQRLLDSYKDPRDSVWLNVREDDLVAEVGDDVDLLNFDGSALWGSPYRLHAYRFTRAGSHWEMDLGSPRDVAEAEMAQLREEMRLSRAYGQGADNEMTMVFFDNIKGATTPPGIPLRGIFETPAEAKAVNEVRVLSLAMQPFRSYVGGPDIARTESVLSTGSHSHGYNRPSHQHGAATTFDIGDTVTTEDGTPPHTHPVAYVLHAIAQHDAVDPAGQQTNPTADGVPHSHGGNVGPHSHGAPAGSSARATIGSGIGGQNFARPDSDQVVDDWVTSPLWSKIDEVTPDDATTSISSAGAGVSASATGAVNLSNVSDPGIGPGHILRLRHREAHAEANFGFFQLRQGYVSELSLGTLIASFNPPDNTSWTTFVGNLTEAQGNSITDYTDLQVRFNGTNGSQEPYLVYISQIELEVPIAHTHTVVSDTHTHGASDATDLGDPTSGNSAVGGPHTHSLDPDGANHLHGLPSDGGTTGVTGTTAGHSHTWALAAHDHLNILNFNEPSLTTDSEDDSFHDHSMQGHVHVAGIFETPYLSPSVGLMIDGTDRTTALGGPWAGPVELGIDVTEFVKAIGTHTLEFFEQANGKLGRLEAAVLIKFFIQSGVGG